MAVADVAEKLDLRKELKNFYTSPRKPSIVDVPPGWFLTYSGRGEPGGEEYGSSIGALYTVAYTLKFMSKAGGRDFTVLPLESLWWLDDPKGSFRDVPRREWNWKSMIRVPDFVTGEQVETARVEARAKKGLEAVNRVVLEEFHEGLSAQIIHIGPYAEEEPTITKLHEFMRKAGYEIHGHHHEIYLSDPNRTAPERLRTLIRQPVRRA